MFRIEVVRLAEHRNLFVDSTTRHRIAGVVVVNFGLLHSVVVVDSVKTRRIAELVRHRMVVDHRIVLRVVSEHMMADLTADYVAAGNCNYFELHRWADMMMAVRHQSILLGNCLQKNIRNCFPAKRSSVDDHQTFLPGFPSVRLNCVVYFEKTQSNWFADCPASCRHPANFPLKHQQCQILQSLTARCFDYGSSHRREMILRGLPNHCHRSSCSASFLRVVGSWQIDRYSQSNSCLHYRVPTCRPLF